MNGDRGKLARSRHCRFERKRGTEGKGGRPEEKGARGRKVRRRRGAISTFEFRNQGGSKNGGGYRSRNLLWPWIKHYSGAKSHLQQAQSFLTITQAPVRASLGSSPPVEKVQSLKKRPQRRKAAPEGGSPRRVNDLGTIGQQGTSVPGWLSLSFSVGWDDATRFQDTSLDTATRTKRQRRSPSLWRPNSTPNYIIFRENVDYRTVLGCILRYVRQHCYAFLTPTPDGAPLLRGAMIIGTVTLITCHQSQITGESTCPLGHAFQVGID
jgi:hypothetical protein